LFNCYLIITVMNEPLHLAQQEWKRVFNYGIYTSFTMLDFMIVKSALIYEDFLQNPRFLVAEDNINGHDLRNGKKEKYPSMCSTTKAQLLQHPDSDFLRLWSDGTGRCTSFAIGVAKELEHNFPGIFDFVFFELGAHHLARCWKTSKVIDSSSAQVQYYYQKMVRFTSKRILNGRTNGSSSLAPPLSRRCLGGVSLIRYVYRRLYAISSKLNFCVGLDAQYLNHAYKQGTHD
jgi:hypothetical protein